MSDARRLSLPALSNGRGQVISQSNNGSQGIQFAAPDHDGHWVATLSDGTTAVEHRGEWKVEPGQRKPWIRLCNFTADNGLHLTSLRLQFRGRTIHMPRETLYKFGMEERARVPLRYAVQYHLEVDDVLSGNPTGDIFVDFAAIYDTFAVHYIQDVSNGRDSWIVVTDPYETAPSPKRKVD